MKKNLSLNFFYFLFLLSFSARAQYINIPDPNFVAWLNNSGYSSCLNGSLLDTTCSAVVNANSINCSFQNISDLTGITYFDNLTNLNCSDNQLSYLPPLPGLLQSLFCSYNQLTSLPDLPAALQSLYCLDNQLSTLPALPSSLLMISAIQNQISSLPTLSTNLQYLYVDHNNLTSIPPLPSSLVSLHCDFNFLNALPTLPTSLGILHCTSNSITSLPSLSSSIYELWCDGNQLSSLPSLPSALVDFHCENNVLTTLPALPTSLNSFYCYNNQLASLPSLPASMYTLNCGQNLLTALPPLPANIGSLSCGANQISTLNSLPPAMTFLDCPDNLLTSLPPLPDSLYRLNISNNPISCLPEIKKINYFFWSNTNITCLPDYGKIYNSTPSVSGLPLCQPSGNCPSFWNISGNIYNDSDGNCMNNSEDNLNYIPVKLDSAGIVLQQFLTNAAGNYSFRTGYGSYTISVDTTGLPFTVLCPPTFSHTSVISVNNSYDSLAHFGLQCKPGFDLEAKSIAPNANFRPGALRILHLDAGDAVRFYGSTCSNGINGSVEVILDGPISYLSPAIGAITPSAVNGDTISWIVPDFSLSNPVTDFNILVSVPTTANIGDTICIQLSVTPVVGDNDPSNNSIISCYPVVNSLDPNEKLMSPSGMVDSSQQWFTFTIFFQNTGNATAEDIYLLDTLSNNLDVSTFSFLSSSHDVITQVLPGNALRFNYPDINLPDSTTNEPASHGYVQFKIKKKAGLPAGTVINNKAFIYFDFNIPIITNTVSATITVPVTINEFSGNSILISPNPATGIIHINTSSWPVNKIEIFNLFGQKMMDKILLQGVSSTDLNLSDLSKGVYFIKLSGEQLSVVRKIMKETGRK